MRIYCEDSRDVDVNTVCGIFAAVDVIAVACEPPAVACAPLVPDVLTAAGRTDFDGVQVGVSALLSFLLLLAFLLLLSSLPLMGSLLLLASLASLCYCSRAGIF